MHQGSPDPSIPYIHDTAIPSLSQGMCLDEGILGFLGKVQKQWGFRIPKASSECLLMPANRLLGTWVLRAAQGNDSDSSV